MKKSKVPVQEDFPSLHSDAKDSSVQSVLWFIFLSRNVSKRLHRHVRPAKIQSPRWAHMILSDGTCFHFSAYITSAGKGMRMKVMTEKADIRLSGNGGFEFPDDIEYTLDIDGMGTKHILAKKDRGANKNPTVMKMGNGPQPSSRTQPSSRNEQKQRVSLWSILSVLNCNRHPFSWCYKSMKNGEQYFAINQTAHCTNSGKGYLYPRWSSRFDVGLQCKEGYL